MNETGNACPTPATAAVPENYANVGRFTTGRFTTGRTQRSHENSYIANAPENAVVLSDRLSELCERVGGCQTEQVKAVIRRVIFEVLNNEKR